FAAVNDFNHRPRQGHLARAVRPQGSWLATTR
ncbi:MAG: hypothetical protein ACI89X_004229, partial [Planctomycetota bacterium]